LAVTSALVITFATVALAALYALPNGDDFCRAGLQPLIGSVNGWHASTSALGYTVDSWRFWTGRWASMWIEAAALHSLDVASAYPVALLLAWVPIFAGLWVAVRHALPQSNSILATALLFALFWSIVPEPGESLFWFTGAVENVLPVALAGAAVALLTRDKWWPAIPFSIIVPGLHELFGMLFIAVLAAGAVMARRRLPWLVCAVLALFSEAIVFAAPGNAFRVAATVRDPASTLGLTIWQLFRYLPDWSLSGALLAATGAIISSRPQIPWAEHFAGWRLAIIPALTLGFAVAAIIISTYVLKAPLAPRTLAGICLALLLGWLLTAIAAAPRFQANPTLVSLSSIALAGCLVLQGNTRAGLFDLKYKVRPWHHAMTARYSDLRLARGRALLVARPPDAPSVFIWRDILEDPNDYRNVCLASYFGARAVALRGR
jgi:hypothetical protein